MSFADEYGLSAEDFQAISTQTKETVNRLFEQGGFGAIEKAYRAFDGLTDSMLSIEQVHLRMVLGNIIVMG